MSVWPETRVFGSSSSSVSSSDLSWFSEGEGEGEADWNSAVSGQTLMRLKLKKIWRLLTSAATVVKLAL